ncbi:isocitrate lyase/PEP mutase family protein [Streptomyces sp. NPDC004230]
MPNVWDGPSALLFKEAGFKSIATSSATLAAMLGRIDGIHAVSRDEHLDHAVLLTSVSGLPINGDFEDGYGETPEDVRATVDAAIARGLAGIGIEDTTGDPSNPIRDFDDAVSRVEAAASAAHGQIVLTGRTDNLLWGVSDIDDTIRRLTAYAEAGADVLYAPSLPDMASISAVIRAVTPQTRQCPDRPSRGPTAYAHGAPGDRRPTDQPRSRRLHTCPRGYAGGCCETCEGRPGSSGIESQLRPHHRPHQGLSSRVAVSA